MFALQTGTDTWHLFKPNVRRALPDHNVSVTYALLCFLQCFLPAHRFLTKHPAFIGFPFKLNCPFRGQIWFATPHTEKDKPLFWI